MPTRRKVRKPEDSTEISYCVGRRLGKTNRPSSPVTVDCENPVPTSVALIEIAGTTPPLLSVTTPTIWPACWPSAVETSKQPKTTNQWIRRQPRVISSSLSDQGLVSPDLLVRLKSFGNL